MAIIAGVDGGRVCIQPGGATDSRAPIRLGKSASAITPTAAATITLPTPVNGSYLAYLLYAAGNMWWCWTDGSGAATPGGANCYLLSGANILVAPPPGATSISVIFDASSTAGSLCAIGVY